MAKIIIADTTLCGNGYSFREKLEIARQLEKLQVDMIEFPEISNVKTDTLLIRTVSAFVKDSAISVAAGSNAESIENACAALTNATRARIRIELPVSTVGMEYLSHRKPAKMLEWIGTAVKTAVEKGISTECCFLDATRAEKDFLFSAIKVAEEAGADMISVCDSSAEMLPDDFAEFAASVKSSTSLPVGVRCSDANGLASAQAVLAVKKGISCVKTGNGAVDLEKFAQMVKNCGVSNGLETNIKYTKLHSIMRRLEELCSASAQPSSLSSRTQGDEYIIKLSASDDKDTVISAVTALGYDLASDDAERVYDEFLREAAKKVIGAKELVAIVSSTVLQVPATYTLENYMITSGNIMQANAQISLVKDGKCTNGVSLGDGPINAAFKAIEQITGVHYELDDFQIQSVTEGVEAIGSAIVKLRSGGKLYSGNGISTDIIGASIRAYISALNKIVYEESQA